MGQQTVSDRIYGCIYLATNQQTQKHYIGQTSQPMQTRWKRHVSDALGRKERPYPLHNAIRKYGASCWRVLTVATAETFAELNRLEQFFIEAYGTLHPRGYNLKPGGNNAGHHEETKRKLGDALRGRQLSESMKAKLSAIHKVRPLSPGQLAGLAKLLQMNAAKKGQPGRQNTQEARQAMSAARKGKRHSAAHAAAIGRAHIGMVRSDEARQHMRDAWRLRRQRGRDADIP